MTPPRLWRVFLILQDANGWIYGTLPYVVPADTSDEAIDHVLESYGSDHPAVKEGWAALAEDVTHKPVEKIERPRFRRASE